MTFIVIAIDADGAALARRFLPPTDRVVSGARRVYFVYQTIDGTNYAFNDLDGVPIIECHTFPTLAAATAWMRDDDMRGAA